MMAAVAAPQVQWIDVCSVDDIVPDSGVCALLGLRQVALVRVGEEERFFAIDNFDPFAKAFVLSRGIVGDRNGVPVIASPIYKNAFDLRSGQSLDDAAVQLRTWPVRVVAGRVEIGEP
jgi:nitrite reductase (NADH) small subunit